MARPTALLPFVPGGQDFQKSRELFRELGFDQLAFASNLMIKIELPDLDAWWIELTAKNLSDRFPGVRLKPPTDYPWGREVHLIDLAGVCWHFGLP